MIANDTTYFKPLQRLFRSSELGGGTERATLGSPTEGDHRRHLHVGFRDPSGLVPDRYDPRILCRQRLRFLRCPFDGCSRGSFGGVLGDQSASEAHRPGAPGNLGVHPVCTLKLRKRLAPLLKVHKAMAELASALQVHHSTVRAAPQCIAPCLSSECGADWRSLGAKEQVWLLWALPRRPMEVLPNICRTGNEL